MVFVPAVLFFSRPRSQGWPHHVRTFSVILTDSSTESPVHLSTSWCFPSRPCLAFIACIHLASFLAFSLFLDNIIIFRINFINGDEMMRLKGKVFPYSLPSVGPGADPGVQAVSPQVTWSESRHLLSSSLPLLSARPAVTPVAFTRWRYL